ncbi:MAG: hypothetical protein ACKVRP_09035 [Bacteroidota bacterium]
MRRWTAYIVILFAAVLFSAHRGWAQDVTARAWVDSTRFLIGDWIKVHVDLKHPVGVQFRAIVGDTLGDFHIIERGPVNSKDPPVTTTHLVVARYDSGVAVLPPIPFLYASAGDTSSRRIETNPVVLTIAIVEVDTSQAIKDIKPPLSIPWTLAEIALLVGIVLALAGLAYFGYRYWKKRQVKDVAEVYVAPPRPAYVLALEELGVIKEKKLWQQGLIKQYYSEVTEVVRRYFENRYAFMALEQTSDEIMFALKRHPGAQGIWNETERALRLADLVKFAKYQPGVSEHEELMLVAYEIIEKTKPQPVQLPSSTIKEEVHAGA